MDKICLKGLRFYACHGIFAEEKKRRQLFTVNIELGLDISLAAASDSIEQSVDYGQIYLIVRQAVENNCFNLLETLAEYIADLLLQNHMVKSVHVEVEKNNACYEGQFFSALVAIDRGRN